MSKDNPIEIITDGNGRISVRTAFDVVVYTKEENELIIDEYRRLRSDNEDLRKVAKDAWQLFVKHGAIHPCDMPEVDEVRNNLRELDVLSAPKVEVIE